MCCVWESQSKSCKENKLCHALEELWARTRAQRRRELCARALGDPSASPDGGLAEPERLPPCGTVSSEVRPGLRRNVEHLQRLVNAATVRHIRGSWRSGMRDPRREHAARQAVIVVHAPKMTEPA